MSETATNGTPASNDAKETPLTVITAYAWPIAVVVICIILLILLCMCRPELKGVVARLRTFTMKRSADGSIEVGGVSSKDYENIAICRRLRSNRVSLLQRRFTRTAKIRKTTIR